MHLVGKTLEKTYRHHGGEGPVEFTPVPDGEGPVGLRQCQTEKDRSGSGLRQCETEKDRSMLVGRHAAPKIICNVSLA